ncbi:hypothetical protein LTR62_004712 [Meristemomyces frigidus]|uniref:Cytokinesis regulator n=1 Tax=Meristemomyces frigidus TaxID=1508187 RepID=A0AAN7TQG5_9PEZI|nr:hypothetical protein LTR62_004712 [Meristemomyces frigidus]
MATVMDAETNWDDDFDGDLQPLGISVGTTHTHTSVSSRLSVQSESLAGDDDWNVVLQSSDEQSTTQAIQSAKQAGIPLPINVPASALLGGTIKRLGEKKSRPKINNDDDWGIDFDEPAAPSAFGGLQLKKPIALEPHDEAFDDFDELEGSLGTRFAGQKHDGRGRSSSASIMSPSMGSVTAESEADDMRDLELPDEPMDFQAILQKRKAAEAELSDLSQQSPAIEQPATMSVHKKHKLLSDDNEDFLNDLDFGGGEILHNRKTRLNKNLKIKDSRPVSQSPRPATTLNFHDKPVDKPMHMRSHLPRPVSGSKPHASRLEPVFESGASNPISSRRQANVSSGSNFLRSKRSMPVIGSQRTVTAPQKPTYIPSSASNYSQQTHASAQRAMPYHLRRDSDPNRQGAQSPPPRSYSRLSNAFVPDTPSRGVRAQPRKDMAPAALAREAAAKRSLTKPARRRNYGDGNELEVFDDLPTSHAKESKFIKEPVGRGPPRAPTLRQTNSRIDMRGMDPIKRTLGTHIPPDRMMTPAPPRTPASPTKGFHQPSKSNTPSYLRDTAASRIARESKVAPNVRPRSQGPLMPMSTNTFPATDWKAQVAARSPHTSPSAPRLKLGRAMRPTLFKELPGALATNAAARGMTYNAQKQRWEGNENMLHNFEVEFPPPLQTPTPTSHQPQTSYMDRHLPQAHSSSPPRPALIAPMSAAGVGGVQVNGGMVFDPRQMRWLKLKGDQRSHRDASGPISPSVTDGEGEEEDAFAGIDDLPDENFLPATNVNAGGSVAGMASPISMAAAGVGEVHEEFDLGPRFISTQREEEEIWRRRCEAWFLLGPVARADEGGWRWRIREMVGTEASGDL